MSMTSGNIPSYLNHLTFTPSENVLSVQLQIGTGIRNIVLTGDYPSSVSETTVIDGIINLDANGNLLETVVRLAVKKPNGGLDYYTSSSSGGQNWSYADGVLTISNTSGFVFGAFRYDVFYW